MATYIDFGAFRKGVTEGKNAQLADLIREQDILKTRAATFKQLDDYADTQRTRMAQNYMSSLQQNLSNAAAAGVKPTDYYVQQLAAIQKDPYFRDQMDPRTQQLVLTQLRAGALNVAQQALATDQEGAQSIYNAYGAVLPLGATDIAMAAYRNDPAKMAEALASKWNVPVTYNAETKKFNFNGMEIEADQAFSKLASSQSGAGLHDLAFGNRKEMDMKQEAEKSRQATIDTATNAATMQMDALKASTGLQTDSQILQLRLSAILGMDEGPEKQKELREINALMGGGTTTPAATPVTDSLAALVPAPNSPMKLTYPHPDGKSPSVTLTPEEYEQLKARYMKPMLGTIPGG